MLYHLCLKRGSFKMFKNKKGFSLNKNHKHEYQFFKAN
jgi:hypothetical protein